MTDYVEPKKLPGWTKPKAASPFVATYWSDTTASAARIGMDEFLKLNLSAEDYAFHKSNAPDSQ